MEAKDYIKLIKELPEKAPPGISFSEEEIKRKACKHLPATRRAIQMYQYLSKLKGKDKFDFEVSVDETDLPTSQFRATLWLRIAIDNSQYRN